MATDLATREQAVALLVEGYSTRQVAAEFGVSDGMPAIWANQLGYRYRGNRWRRG